MGQLALFGRFKAKCRSRFLHFFADVTVKI